MLMAGSFYVEIMVKISQRVQLEKKPLALIIPILHAEILDREMILEQILPINFTIGTSIGISIALAPSALSVSEPGIF